MSFQVTVKPSNHTFSVEPDETVLDAALRQGLAFPYGCRNGACGACVGKVLTGSVRYAEPPMALSEEEAAAGQGIFCEAIPESDLVIEVHEVGSDREIPVKTMPCRIEQMDRLNDDVMCLYLALPEGERLQFLAGQYLDILLPDGKRRAFSIANAPHNDERIQLHVRLIKGGRFTQKVFGELKVGDILRIEGPHGSFYLREESERPIILLATGTGFGPIKGILEHAFTEGVSRPITLYWGARQVEDLYQEALPRKWAAHYSNFTFVPVLSQASDADLANGYRRGYVQEAVLADYQDLSPFEVYACGMPEMVLDARRKLVARGLESEHCYSDAFEWAKD